MYTKQFTDSQNRPIKTWVLWMCRSSYEDLICKKRIKTQFLTIFKKHVFYCAFQLISIKLQLGYYNLDKEIQLTNTIRHNKHDNIKKKIFKEICKKNWVICFCKQTLHILLCGLELFVILLRMFSCNNVINNYKLQIKKLFTVNLKEKSLIS